MSNQLQCLVWLVDLVQNPKTSTKSIAELESSLLSGLSAQRNFVESIFSRSDLGMPTYLGINVCPVVLDIPGLIIYM